MFVVNFHISCHSLIAFVSITIFIPVACLQATSKAILPESWWKVVHSKAECIYAVSGQMFI